MVAQGGMGSRSLPTKDFCCRPASRRCTRQARSPRNICARDPRPRHARHPRCSGSGSSRPYASTQTILVNDPQWPSAYYLEQNKLRRVAGSTHGLYEPRRSPASTSRGARACRGAVPRHPVWFKRRSARRRRCKVHGGVFNRRAEADAKPQIIATDAEDVRGHERSTTAAAQAAGGATRRDRRLRCRPACRRARTRGSTRRSTRCFALGPAGSLALSSSTATSNYKQTGLLQAFSGSFSLLHQPPKPRRLRVGLPSLRLPRAARRSCVPTASS